MRKTVSISGVRQMIQKSRAVALAAIIVVGFGSSVALAMQSGDQFESVTEMKRIIGSYVNQSLAGKSPDSLLVKTDYYGRPGPASEQVLNAKTEWQLATTMVAENFNFPAVPFSEVIEAMHDSYGLNVLLDESAQDDELQEDTIVSIKLQDVSLEHALEILLGKHNATFIIRAGKVQVISKDVEDDRDFFETRIFDCAELSKALPPKLTEYVPARKKEEGQTEPIDTLTTLEKLIRENIHSDSWMITGTGDAILHEINGKLMVNNSGSALRDTRRFLEYLNAEFVVKE